jgi:multiple sugar transport system ATP-binding protein
MVLLGPSGCGKSTTLRMIAGLETISDGDIAIDGQRVNDLPAKDRDIAMVFQSYALYPHMNVRDNLAFGLRRRRIEKAEIERRVAQAASSLGLGPYLDRRPNALSGGQRQRVAVGRAIVRDPKVFLFDEPLSNLDASLRVSTRAELAALHQRLGATMIYVTHDQVEAMTMGTRICIMKDGRVMQVGAPMDVYREPQNTFVAGFLGSPPMNLVPAEVVASGTGTELRLGEARLPLRNAAAPGPVTLGIRPEELQVAGDRQDEACVRGSVTSIEQLGAETIVALDLPNGGILRARLDNRARVKLGEILHLRPTSGSLHLFDLASGDLVGRD